MEVDKQTFVNELTSYVKEIQYRVHMSKNWSENPILDTFDYLDLQEAQLRIQQINARSENKQRKCLTNNKTRRGGRRNRDQRYKEQARIANYIVPLQANEPGTKDKIEEF